MTMFDYQTPLEYTDQYGNDYLLYFFKFKYVTGNIGIGIDCMSSDGYLEPYGRLTTNIVPDYKWLASNQIILDTNNIHENLWKMLINNNCIHITGDRIKSGYCIYPVANVNQNWLLELPEKGR